MDNYFNIFSSINNIIINDKIKENKKDLFGYYKDNKFKYKYLFHLILLYYQIIFHLNEISDSKKYKSFFYIKDDAHHFKKLF